MAKNILSKIYIYIYITEMTLLYSRKLPQHYKSTTLQLKKTSLKKSMKLLNVQKCFHENFYIKVVGYPDLHTEIVDFSNHFNLPKDHF